MDAELAGIVRELKERQEIYEVLVRYCRGMDRLDRELLASCYHPDAVDDHGHFVGPADQFIDWALGIYSQLKLSSHHELTNHSVEIDGDTAHAETYYISTTINTTAPYYSQARGRYVDRLEKRGGRWGIVERICVIEMSGASDDPHSPALLERKYSPRDRTDPSYARPLTVDRARFTV